MKGKGTNQTDSARKGPANNLMDRKTSFEYKSKSNAFEVANNLIEPLIDRICVQAWEKEVLQKRLYPTTAASVVQLHSKMFFEKDPRRHLAQCRFAINEAKALSKLDRYASQHIIQPRADFDNIAENSYNENGNGVWVHDLQLKKQ